MEGERGNESRKGEGREGGERGKGEEHISRNTHGT